jgi:hypothetical protein
VLGADPLGGLHPVAARHPQVHQHDVGVVLRDQVERGEPVGGGADHLDPGQQPEQRDQAFANHRLVVGEHHAQRHAGTVR